MKRPNKQHEINLIKVYNHKKGREKDRFARIKEYRLLVISLVVMVVLSGLSGGYMLFQKYNVNSLTEQINEPAFVKNYNEAVKLEEQANKLLSRCNELDNLVAILATYPKASSDVNDKLVDLSTNVISTEITAYDSSTGILNFVATSKNNLEINSFIQRLSDSKLFSNITYSGYSYKVEEATYSIHVQCYLASDAGRGDQGE